MRKAVPFLLLAVFLALLVPRMMQSIAQGDTYPAWSTMRSDPKGAKVMYLALQRMGLNVRRNYEPWAELAGVRAEYVLLGVPPLLLQDAKGMEKLLSGGGLALVGLRRASLRTSFCTEKLGFRHLPTQGLELRSDDWRCLEGERGNCLLAERKMGSGRVWLLADAEILQNGALHQDRNTALLARLFPGTLPVIFDESHLGVTETGGVGVLLRRYRLFPAMALLLLAALLFVWRSSTPILPEKEPLVPSMTPQPAASLRTLLEQRVPRGRLLETLVSEWKRALPLLPSWQRERTAAMDEALERASGMRDPREGYAELQAAIKLRKGSA